MTLMSISVLGPATLIILLVIIIYLERKQGNLRAKVRDILAVNNSNEQAQLSSDKPQINLV